MGLGKGKKPWRMEVSQGSNALPRKLAVSSHWQISLQCGPESHPRIPGVTKTECVESLQQLHWKESQPLDNVGYQNQRPNFNIIQRSEGYFKTHLLNPFSFLKTLFVYLIISYQILMFIFNQLIKNKSDLVISLKNLNAYKIKYVICQQGQILTICSIKDSRDHFSQ